jgi:hypothetical protein
MGLFSDLIDGVGEILGAFVPGPFHTDYQGDYPEDRHDDSDSSDSGSTD